MMSAQPETGLRRTVPASDRLVENSQRIAWKAHQLGVEIAEREPSAISHALRRAATAEWRRTYLDLPA